MVAEPVQARSRAPLNNNVNEGFMSEPILWVALGALAVQAALFYAKELNPLHFWVLTIFNWACLFALPYAIHTAYL